MPRGFVPPRRRLISVWVLAAVAMAGVLAAARWQRTPGDDRDPARQRPGILDLGPLPEPAPRVDAIDLDLGRRHVVLFARPDRVAMLCSALREPVVPADVDIAVVVDSAASGPGECAPGVSVVTSGAAAAAAAFGLPRARGHVQPTGYVIVDSDGQIRYRTLDPLAPELLDEVATMLRGVP